MKRYYWVKPDGAEVELTADQVKAAVAKGTLSTSNLQVEDDGQADATSSASQAGFGGLDEGGAVLPVSPQSQEPERPWIKDNSGDSMGFEEDFDRGDLVEALFPLGVGAARRGGDTILPSIADAALTFAPGALAVKAAAKVAPKILSQLPRAAKLLKIGEGAANVGTRLPMALEGGIGAAGQLTADQTLGEGASGATAAATGLAPAALPVLGKVLRAPARAAGAGVRAAAAAAEETAPTLAAVAGGVGRTLEESGVPMVQDIKGIVNEQPWKKAGEMRKVASEIGVEADKIPSLIHGPMSANAQLSRKRYLANDLDLIRNVDEAQGKLQGALRQTVKAVGNGAEPMTTDQAGAMLKEVVPQAARLAIEQMDTRFSTIARDIPDLQVSDDALIDAYQIIGPIIEQAQDFSGLGLSVAPFQTLEKLIIGDASFANINRARDLVGRIAYPKGGAVLEQHAPMVEELRKVYQSLSNALVNTAKGYDPKLGEELVKSNKAIQEISKTTKVLSSALGNESKEGSQVLNAVFSGADKVNALKKLVSKDYFDAARQAALAANVIPENAEGISYARLATNLAKQGKNGVLNAMLTGQERKSLRQLATMGKAIDATYPRTGRDLSQVAFGGPLSALVAPLAGNITAEAGDIATRQAVRKLSGQGAAYPTFGTGVMRAAFPETLTRRNSDED